MSGTTLAEESTSQRPTRIRKPSTNPVRLEELEELFSCSDEDSDFDEEDDEEYDDDDDDDDDDLVDEEDGGVVAGGDDTAGPAPKRLRTDAGDDAQPPSS